MALIFRGSREIAKHAAGLYGRLNGFVGGRGASEYDAISNVGNGAGESVAALYAARALNFFLSFERITGVGHREQARNRDGFAGLFADAVGATLHTFNGFKNFGEQGLLAGKEVECEVALEGLGTGITQMLAVAGRGVRRVLVGFFEGIFGMLQETLLAAGAKSGEESVIFYPLGWNLRFVVIRAFGAKGIETKQFFDRGGTDVAGALQGLLGGKLGLLEFGGCHRFALFVAGDVDVQFGTLVLAQVVAHVV